MTCGLRNSCLYCSVRKEVQGYTTRVSVLTKIGDNEKQKRGAIPQNQGKSKPSEYGSHSCCKINKQLKNQRRKAQFEFNELIFIDHRNQPNMRKILPVYFNVIYYLLPVIYYYYYYYYYHHYHFF
jgi:hypothetical protein